MPQAVNQSALPAMDPTVEQVIVTFDFSGQLNPGITILGVLDVTCTVSPASLVQDPMPATRLIDNTVIIDSPLNTEPAQAFTQLIGNMVAGVIYVLQGVVLTSDGQQLSLWFNVPCIQPI